RQDLFVWSSSGHATRSRSGADTSVGVLRSGVHVRFRDDTVLTGPGQSRVDGLPAGRETALVLDPQSCRFVWHDLEGRSPESIGGEDVVEGLKCLLRVPVGGDSLDEEAR